MLAGSEHRTLEKRLDSGGWGLLFIWVGVALAMNVGWGVGLLGVGLIILAVQAARKWQGIVVDRFSLAVGVLLIVGAIWRMLDVSVDLVPLLIIGAGVALLVSAVGGKPHRSRRHIGPGTPAPHSQT